MRIAVWFTLAFACRGQATPVDACDPAIDPPFVGTCSPCATDGACIFQGNPCTESVSCASIDDELAFPAIGCNESQEYSWPDDDECVCVAERCTAFPE